mmetsp:Transcript_158482/g.508400  ORF Transcript_158482/g.508400 Transcript_158482/m.508400 type:complete len:337 (+) Transcript_158482:928-1938(+)
MRKLAVEPEEGEGTSPAAAAAAAAAEAATDLSLPASAANSRSTSASPSATTPFPLGAGGVFRRAFSARARIRFTHARMAAPCCSALPAVDGGSPDSRAAERSASVAKAWAIEVAASVDITRSKSLTSAASTTPSAGITGSSNLAESRRNANLASQRSKVSTLGFCDPTPLCSVLRRTIFERRPFIAEMRLCSSCGVHRLASRSEARPAAPFGVCRGSGSATSAAQMASSELVTGASELFAGAALYSPAALALRRGFFLGAPAAEAVTSSVEGASADKRRFSFSFFSLGPADAATSWAADAPTRLRGASPAMERGPGQGLKNEAGAAGGRRCAAKRS